MKPTAIALLTTALPLQAAGAIQLLPAGEFSGRDGRPGKELMWKLPDDKGRALAALMNAQHAKIRFNFDYEHQTIYSQDNGQPAPASGWATKFEWRDGRGMWATDVQWTARATQMIEADEYAYISPVIVYDRNMGEITAVINAALTNIPNLELQPAAQQLFARLSAIFSSTTEPSDMNPVLKALLKALGLPDDATEVQATAALTALQTARSDLTALLKSLGVAETTDATTATTAVAALRAKADKADTNGAGEPDPTKYVSLDKFNQLNTEVAALRASGVSREVDELIAQATNDGKCAGVVADVWRDVGKKDVAQLRALIKSTPVNPALAGRTQTDGKGPAGGGGEELDANTLAADANKYMAEQQALGNLVTSAEAVKHVINTGKKG